MRKIILLLIIMLISGSAFAEPISITPVEEIATYKKDFQLGNIYKFVDNKNNLYTGTVVYYRQNGITGQEAQIEISNFVDSNNNYIPGKITIIPENHKILQEAANVPIVPLSFYIRGSEICIKPNVHTFLINNINTENPSVVIPIKPNQEISTAHDELEDGDLVEFTTIADVYKNGKRYISKGTPIYGVIFSIDENGWVLDNATIHFKEFITKDVNNKKIVLKADLTIDGFEILKYKKEPVKQFFNMISTICRGKEVDIKQIDEEIKFVLITKK